MEKIQKILAEYGVSYIDIAEREDLLKIFTKESLYSLITSIRILDNSNNPYIYEIRKNIEKILTQITENESKLRSENLSKIIDEYFLDIGIDVQDPESQEDKKIFIKQINEISYKHFNFDKTIERISSRDYFKSLLDMARESFLGERMTHF